jgi:uncharacterized protein (DUF1800 family)
VDPEAAGRAKSRLERYWRVSGRRKDASSDEVREVLRARSGLNENYARELLELHTLGVDGGYTQKDVTEVARAFTGWTIKGLHQQSPRFHFQPRVHDSGTKHVMGRAIRPAGEAEGREILAWLANHKTTARFVSAKLARRLVADEPPPALVERAAAAFRRTRGDIREVVRAIVTSPEFMSPEVRRAKVKTPLEFVVSAVRASGARASSASELAKRAGAMGMPLYLQQPPTGYKDTADAWVSTSGLLARLNFALDLAAGRVAGVEVPPGAFAGTAASGPALTEALGARLVPGGLSASTRETLAAEAQGGLTPERLAGLVLGSPEFQRR